MDAQTKIWVLIESGETLAVYARLDDQTLFKAAGKIVNAFDDEDDPETLEWQAEVAVKLKNEIDGKDSLPEFMDSFSLIPVEIKDCGGDCLIEKGAKIYEAAQRVSFGCDMAYTHTPFGFYCRQKDMPEELCIDWIERTVE